QHSQDRLRRDRTVSKMKSVFVFVFAAIFSVADCQHNSGARTFDTSQKVDAGAVGHDVLQHGHQTHVFTHLTHGHGHEHSHQQSSAQQVPSPGVAVPSGTVQTVPVLIGQVVNIPVVQTVPQQTAVGSAGGASGAFSSLVQTQQQVVGNITSGFGTVVTSFVNPVVALLRNASVWLNRTAQSGVLSQKHDHTAAHSHGTIGSHGAHSHGIHAHDGAHSHGTAGVHGHDSAHVQGLVNHAVGAVHGHQVHGQVSPVGSIPVFIINGAGGQDPTATIGAGVPVSLGLSPNGQSSTADQSPVFGSQLFPFGVPAPVAALGNFLASAAAPILGTAAPTTTVAAEVSSVTASTTFADASSGNVTLAVPAGNSTSTVAASVP
ncbi:unnamed protein product, partial [Ixodes hexagonus]